MLPVKPERAVKVKHQQPKTSNKRFVRNAAEQLLHGRSIADHSRLNTLGEPRATHSLTLPMLPLGAVFALYVSMFVVVRCFHLLQ